MAEMKKLVLVVEGTAALGPHWRTIVNDYLEKIIRSLCGDEDTKPDSPTVEMALVNFNAHGSYSSCLTQRSGWTKNMDTFLDWLSALNFSGGGFCDAAIAEGLAEVLMMFPSVNGNQNHQRHCILISASNPYPLPTPIYIPPNYLDMESKSHLSDAETVSKYFKKGLVSLSVICPRQLSKLRAIYDSAKRTPSETDPTIHIVKNPNYLVLISESFMEARTALEITNLPSTQSSTAMDVTPASSVIESSLKIPPATVKEPNTNTISAETCSSLSGQAESATLPETSSTNTVGPTQQTSSASRYIKLWEGDLSVERQGKVVFITKLQGYRNTKTSELLAKDWPSTMQIDRLIPEDETKTKNYTGKVDYIILKAMNENSTFFAHMQEKKLNMVVKLPSQMLLLSVSAEKVNHLVGMVFPQEMVKYDVVAEGK